MNRNRLAVLVLGLLVVAGAVHAATVATPTFDKAHGFYSGTITVSISSATSGATIRYTTDGQAPSASYGTVGSSVTLSTTTCLRAIALKGGYTASDTYTQTYVFLDKVIYQPNRPAGFPASWPQRTKDGGTTTIPADYEMDPEIRNKYGAATLKNSLKAIPTLSIAAKTSDFFSADLYGCRPPWHQTEVPCSVEFWYGDNPGRGFQINCCIRGHSWAVEKRAFRIKFKSPFGPTSLSFPIFEKAPLHATSKTGFDKLVLRSGLNRCFAFWCNPKESNYTRDQWVRDTQLSMGGAAARGTFAHLYINGVYWGLYNITERPDHKFNSQWRGGSQGDWHARHHAGTISGSGSRFDTAVSKARAGDYTGVQSYLDIDQYCDYIIANWYCGTGDWPDNNWYAGVRNNPAGKTFFMSWDAEDCWDKMGSNQAGRSNDGAWVHPAFRSGSGRYALDQIWHGLRGNSNFIKAFSARVDKHCYNGGALTESNCKARWDTLCANVQNAIYAESARWGDGELSTPVTFADWVTERDLVRGRMTGNVQRFINALKAYNYYVPGSTPQPPAAPGSLAAAAQSATSIRLTWTDNSSNETGFKIDRRKSGTTTWERIATPAANATAYTDSGLAAGTPYYYQVKATNGAGDSPYSNTASATTGETAPAAPGSLAAAAQSATSIRLTWTDNSGNETGFKIDRRKSGTTTWERIATPAANATAYTDSGLAAATQYDYQVKATNGAGDSPYSNTASATTGETAPAAPGSLAAAAQSATSIRLTWTDNSSNETGFKIDRRKSGTTTWERIATPAANATSYTDSGLTGSTQYYYQVKATSSAGDSPYSNVAAATTQAGVPAAPSGVAASATSASSIQVTWADNSSDETGFKLDRRQSGTDSWVRVKQTGANVTACTDSGLASATPYYYKLMAFNAAGDSAYSAVAAAMTAEGLPAQPTDVAATAASTTEIRITWTDNSSNETRFKIRRSLDGVDFYVLDPLYPAADATTATDAGLTPGTTYYYMMRAEGAAGVSAYTDPVSATTQVGVPAAPSGLTATAVSSSGIDLSWTDNSSNETAFKIDRRQSGTTPWVRVAEPAAGVTGYSDVGLPADTHFYYKVKAANSAGDSAYSSVAAATTEAASGPAPKIEKGSTWRYRKGTAEASARPEMWRSPGFDDSGWSSGSAPFGYGGLSYGTKLADMRNSYACLFLRKTFTVTDPALVTRLEVDVDYDDGFILWINGHEVARVNVPGAVGEPVAHDETCAGYVSAGTAAWTGSLSGGGLPELGTVNVVAVQLFNNSIGSGDAMFDAALSVVEYSLPVADDADQDVLPDDWEQAALGGTGESADGDKDGDGMSNLEEYIAGTDPRQKGSWFMVDVGLSAGQIVVSFQTRAASGAGYEGESRHYALERCTGAGTQGTWTPVPGYENILGAGQNVVYTDTAPDVPSCFRARVWLEAD